MGPVWNLLFTEKKTEGGVNMDVVKLPKKARMVCYEIMDGKEGALDTLESFSE